MLEKIKAGFDLFIFVALGHVHNVQQTSQTVLKCVCLDQSTRKYFWGLWVEVYRNYDLTFVAGTKGHEYLWV